MRKADEERRRSKETKSRGEDSQEKQKADECIQRPTSLHCRQQEAKPQALQICHHVTHTLRLRGQGHDYAHWPHSSIAIASCQQDQGCLPGLILFLDNEDIQVITTAVEVRWPNLHAQASLWETSTRPKLHLCPPLLTPYPHLFRRLTCFPSARRTMPPCTKSLGWSTASRPL